VALPADRRGPGGRTGDVRADRVIELAVPFASVGLPGNGEARFAVTILEGDHELERFPSSGFLAVPVDPEGLDLQEWMV